ncbi:MAG: cell surface protein, partial [Beijerinckiaceae bacterium]
MANTVTAAPISIKTPMQYLDKAVGALRDLGLQPSKTEDAPINALLEKISDLDKDKIAIIARTLGQTSVFNDVVREQTAAMDIGTRYQDIAQSFNSIRDDAKTMVDQIGDGKIDMLERVTNVWMKISRGDIADRFDSIRKKYLEVTNSTKDQIKREGIILDAYRDFRGALKQSEVMALEVLKTAEMKLDAEKQALGAASKVVGEFAGTEPAERARLEMV